eukprot:gnl/TRDRNA2_/TRDRNA2_205314_c0_seq1.p1 gnl/TRDRNA2_/TRDRNA2_205314_c0~~gnl/TRDRNA2_/TRDRNA2_205314_c0_seq1.p1  ORF type:complete len:172 (+),score=20.19 gnl/TRDRNA2_/TRDRNA2_205314_c0_seq1:79-594(+)
MGASHPIEKHCSQELFWLNVSRELFEKRRNNSQILYDTGCFRKGNPEATRLDLQDGMKNLQRCWARDEIKAALAQYHQNAAFVQKDLDDFDECMGKIKIAIVEHEKQVAEERTRERERCLREADQDRLRKLDRCVSSDAAARHSCKIELEAEFKLSQRLCFRACATHERQW